MQVSIKLDSDISDLRSRLNDFKDLLKLDFDLQPYSIAQNAWERHRDDFINRVTSTEAYWKEIRHLRENNRPFVEWISPLIKLIETNSSSYDAMYMLGTIYEGLGDNKNAIKYLKMVVKLSANSELTEKAVAKLREIGYNIW